MAAGRALLFSSLAQVIQSSTLAMLGSVGTGAGQLGLTGHPSLVMAVIKESQANTVEVSDAIKTAIDEAKLHPDLKQFTVEKIFVQGDTIRFSLDQVVGSGRQGGLLAIFVLLFFLRRLRLTLIISLAIPVSGGAR